MHATTKLKILALSLLLVPGVSFGDNHAVGSTFTESLTLDEAVVLDVSTGSGSIEVSAGPGRDVTVVGRIRVQKKSFWRRAVDAGEIIAKVQASPPVELSDGILRVGRFEDRSLGRRVNISYEIVVPGDTEVRAKTGSGSISVRDVAARVTASSGSGRLTLENIGGPVMASAGSGSIHADEVAGEFDAKTGSGSISLTQTAPGDVRTSTGSGRTELTGVVGALRSSAGSGSITVEGHQAGDWNIGTGSGSIRVALPADAAFELDAESNSGRIAIDHPLSATGKTTRRHVRGEVRGGGPLLKLDTGSGGIRVE
jgi:DUF4097 and DUF4098 domain-containing protein YvlB